MRVDHTARSDHSSHDLPHTKVRVSRTTTSKNNKGSEEEVGGGARAKEGEKNSCRRYTFLGESHVTKSIILCCPILVCTGSFVVSQYIVWTLEVTF